VEVALQVYYRASNGDWLVRRAVLPIFAADEHRVFRVKSNLNYKHATNEFNVNYYTDNFGFRSSSPDKVTSIQKAANTYRILFLGPSFSFGMAGNYEDIYVTQIIEQLNADGKIIEAINLGAPAQPPRFQLCWVNEMGPKFDIDLVVQTTYGFSVPTDQKCDKTPPLPWVIDGHLYRKNASLRLKAFALAKKTAIIFYSWYLYQLIIQPESMELGLGTELYKPEATTTADDQQKKYKQFPYMPYDQYTRESYTTYLSSIRDGLERNLEVVSLYIPFGYVVHPEDEQRFKNNSRQNFFSRERQLDYANKTIKGVSGLPTIYIDTTETLIENKKNGRQYNYIDVHLTKEGNRVVANYAAPFIQRAIDKSLQVNKNK